MGKGNFYEEERIQTKRTNKGQNNHAINSIMIPLPWGFVDLIFSN